MRYSVGSVIIKLFFLSTHFFNNFILPLTIACYSKCCSKHDFTCHERLNSRIELCHSEFQEHTTLLFYKFLH